MLDRYVSGLQKGAHKLFSFLFAFSVAGFSLLLILLFTNVVSRNLFGNSFAWIDELSKFIFTWVMFIGIALCIYKKGLIGMEFLTGRLPPKIRHVVRSIGACIAMMFFFVLTLYGIKYVIATADMFSPVLNINYGIVYLCIPLCGMASLFFCVLELASGKSSKKEPGEGGK